jgi:hypothetical protein
MVTAGLRVVMVVFTVSLTYDPAVKLVLVFAAISYTESTVKTFSIVG